MKGRKNVSVQLNDLKLDSNVAILKIILMSVKCNNLSALL